MDVVASNKYDPDTPKSYLGTYSIDPPHRKQT